MSKAKEKDMSSREDHLTVKGDWLICQLSNSIRLMVRLLAVMMTVVIVFCVADVFLVVFEKLNEPPKFLLSVNDIFAVFASFLAVLIAIEIFVNITLYLRDDIIHIRLVVATALMAIARKVIVLDFKELGHQYLIGIALIILALAVAYFLVSKKART